jgi:hypothetical protein
VVDAAGQQVHAADHAPCRRLAPTSRLEPGRTVRDVFLIPAAFSGDGHALRIGVFDPRTGERARVVSSRDAEIVEGGTALLIALP